MRSELNDRTTVSCPTPAEQDAYRYEQQLTALRARLGALEQAMRAYSTKGSSSGTPRARIADLARQDVTGDWADQLRALLQETP